MGTPDTSILDSDFPCNQPSSYWGYPHDYGTPQISITGSMKMEDIFKFHQISISFQPKYQQLWSPIGF